MHELPTPNEDTAIEQFLMTQAVEHSLNNQDTSALPLPEGSTVTLETTGLTINQRFLKGAIGRWLGEQGLRIQFDGQKATYRIQVLIQSLGTEQSQSFFGIPPVQSVLIPFALPEISLYKAHYQTGFTRFRLDIFETTTGQFVRSTPWLQASTFFNEYTLLFFIDFYRTNMVGPFGEIVPIETEQKDATKIEP